MELSCMVNTSTLRTHEIWVMISVTVIKTHDQNQLKQKGYILDFEFIIQRNQYRSSG